MIYDDDYRPFSHLMELTHVLNANSFCMPCIMWNNDADEVMAFNGHLITMLSFCRLYLQEMLFNQVLLGLALPDIHQDHLYNKLNNTKPGYSFITDP